jgi:hypothetical protein
MQVVGDAGNAQLGEDRGSGGQVAGQRRGVGPGEDVAPGERQGVGDRLPGSGLPNASQSRTAHGAKIAAATTAGTATSRTRSGRGIDRDVHATIAHVSASHAASLRVSAARPRTTPRRAGADRGRARRAAP